ncbi:hypothetical protein Pmar_PMAR012447 [Perkinsus marinus ATCC 50983]|uniref:Uncharacterized protein n=1 Tax=Perkinsus marinus (strain ATCC 50983 / TXsc) TaxID=423536 RepID=C5K7D1_PERM5|nr:hypothetical protein Pmar_PMAR012447 [Perkinsus marinus ATCC 50983]EER19466.1 hypothetical protein Pmar_PMAR012447 [Perkinsus marinus ATCC 50983]|mmetsp:Transcript_1344/g.1306  ORF Transcript_1344/g.1306 Transcript_1344/m.1306 type:complete len:364 (-) Transcript_1344:36-1127(-)|eukprot:XP_002787670.1 hypothetical protein Pmar_PMAR012447 [Perkinsus marinus ATCC 50983]
MSSSSPVSGCGSSSMRLTARGFLEKQGDDFRGTSSVSDEGPQCNVRTATPAAKRPNNQGALRPHGTSSLGSGDSSGAWRSTIEDRFGDMVESDYDDESDDGSVSSSSYADSSDVDELSSLRDELRVGLSVKRLETQLKALRVSQTPSSGSTSFNKIPSLNIAGAGAGLGYATGQAMRLSDLHFCTFLVDPLPDRATILLASLEMCSALRCKHSEITNYPFAKLHRRRLDHEIIRKFVLKCRSRQKYLEMSDSSTNPSGDTSITLVTEVNRFDDPSQTLEVLLHGVALPMSERLYLLFFAADLSQAAPPLRRRLEVLRVDAPGDGGDSEELTRQREVVTMVVSQLINRLQEEGFAEAQLLQVIQ